jgi:hypothetical protein
MGEKLGSQQPELVNCILSSLATCDNSPSSPHASSGISDASGDCLLGRIRDRELRSNADSPLAEQLSSLLAAGITMRRQWSRPWYDVTDRWLGPRFYLSHARNFVSSRRLVSVVSSQLGRHGGKLPDWPRLLDAAMRSAETLGLCPLLVPHTALFEATREFSVAADLDAVLVDCDPRDTDLGAWLERHFQCLDADQGWLDHRLCVSPIRQPCRNAAPHIDDVPLQDRLSLALPDRTYVVSRRPGGNIDRLVEARLREKRFPVGSVFLNVASEFSATRPSADKCERALEQQAVGWYVLPTERNEDRHLSKCSQLTLSLDELKLSLQQLAAPVPERWGTDTCACVPYLVHCTRGYSGPYPDETLADYRLRLWMASRVPTNHPLVTLCKICSEGILLGSSRITRTKHRCVSFSAVALPELLSRRKFHAHLGRWNWEPYGLLVARQALVQAGAKPVIYGADADFCALNDQDQPFFQPWGTSTFRWSEEQEWRVLGDLRLHQLSYEAVCLFVRTRREAQQLARRFQWPVFWTES